jgi:flagellar protein FliO/FliZ
LLAPLIAVLVILLAPADAWGEPRAPAGPSAPLADTTPLPPSVTGAAEDASRAVGVSTSGAIAKMVVGLAIVLAVIFGVYWLLRSAGRSKRKMGAADGRIEVLSTAPLAPGKSLHLVRVGDDVVLVGAAEQSVTPLRSWSGEDARRLDLALGMPGTPATPGAGGRMIDELRRRTVRG